MNKSQILIQKCLESFNIKKEISFSQGLKLHKKQWSQGKHKEWGDGEDDYIAFFDKPQYAEDGFVLVEIPFKHVDLVDTSDVGRVDRYKQILKDKDMGPSWGVFGRFTSNGGWRPPHENKVSILDGNHRGQAAKSLGRNTLNVIMPKVAFEKYKEVLGK